MLAERPGTSKLEEAIWTISTESLIQRLLPSSLYTIEETLSQRLVVHTIQSPTHTSKVIVIMTAQRSCLLLLNTINSM